MGWMDSLICVCQDGHADMSRCMHIKIDMHIYMHKWRQWEEEAQNNIEGKCDRWMH